MNKRIFSLLTSLAMITSMASMAVCAEGDTPAADPNSGGLEGAGGVEAIIDTDILTVTLPTVTGDAANTFNFNMDPQSLINQSVTADAGRYTGKTYGAGTLFFDNGSDAYSNTSNELVVKVASSVKTDVSVKATISDAEGLTFSTKNDFTDVAAVEGVSDAVKNTDKHIYLAMVTTNGSNAAATTVFDEDGVEKTEEIPALATSNFEVKWDAAANSNTGGYTYALKTGTDPTEYKFKLTGATNPNANWTDLDDVAPKIDLTWSVKKHVDSYLDATTVSTSDLTLDFTAAAGSATVTSAKLNTASLTNFALNSKHYTSKATSISFLTSVITTANKGGTITVTFSDGHEETITIA